MLTSTYADVVRRDRPTYWWRTGQTGSAIPNDGLLFGALLTPGTNTGGFGLPGSNGMGGLGRIPGNNNAAGDGWAIPGPNSPFAVTDYITLECWVWFHTTPNNWQYGLMYRNQNNAFSGMLISTARQLQAWYNGQPATSTEPLLLAQWNHCVITAAALSGTVNDIWVNGRCTVYTQAFGTALFNTGFNFNVGQGNGTNSPPAYLAEAAVYPYRLSGQQVIDLYVAGLRQRERQSVFAAAGFPFPQAAPPPPPPSGLTAIGDLTNRRVALVSDRPR